MNLDKSNLIKNRAVYWIKTHIWPVYVWLFVTCLLWGWLGLQIHFGLIHIHTNGMTGIFEPWANSDTVFYLLIYKYGYPTAITSLFYPLFPYLGICFANIFHLPDLVSLVILSHLFALGSLIFLFEIVKDLRGENTARAVTLFSAIFPTSFYYWGGYPQSLLLLLVLCSHYCARKEKWLLASIFGFLAGLTHSSGLILVIPLFVMAFKSVHKRRGFLRWTLLCAVGFPALGNLLFQAIRIRNGFDSYTLDSYIYFQRIVNFPWVTIIKAVQEAFSPSVSQMMPRVNFIILLIFLAATIWGIRNLPIEISSYFLAGLLLSLSASTLKEALWSFSRIILVVFPLFIFIGDLFKNEPYRKFALGFSLIFWLLFSAVFFSGAWIA